MWQPFDEGKTIGQPGSEEGVILRDDEHSLGARITLERDAHAAPFTITCGVYGWMLHTRFFSTEAEAASEYDKMKASLSDLLAPLADPAFSDRSAFIDAIAAFVESYP
jgi:hypothetical protein